MLTRMLTRSFSVRREFRFVFLTLCLASAGPVVGQGSRLIAADPGSLISMSMDSQVGVLLDEIPAGILRDAAAANALAQGADFWTARAARQTKLHQQFDDGREDECQEH